MTNTDLNVYLVLDKSGSMVSMWTEALTACNEYVKGLKENGSEGRVTLVAFDSTTPYFVLRDKVDIQDYISITSDEVRPGALTPLYDAVGKAISNAVVDNIEKTVVVVMTDGHENASREFNQVTAKALVQQCQSKGWEVLFLGANFDVSSYVANFGLEASKGINLSASSFTETMTRTATRSASYGATGMSINYTDVDREELK